jgi:hypothetical protein
MKTESSQHEIELTVKLKNLRKEKKVLEIMNEKLTIQMNELKGRFDNTDGDERLKIANSCLKSARATLRNINSIVKVKNQISILKPSKIIPLNND